jgi:hypothetical protein
MASNNSPSSSWKVPSAANQAKYNVAPLPDNFEPTEEEKGLLSMYETIKTYERQVARLNQQKAREKMAAREEVFKQSLAQKKKRGRRKKKAQQAQGAEDDDDGDESPVEDDSDVDSDEDEDQTLVERRAAKLESLRDEVEEAKQAMVEDETKEENLREQMMATNQDVDLGPALKRKKLQEPEAGKTLLTSLMKMKTPPHDFSEKLGLKPWKGKVLFPSSPDETMWTPPQSASNPNDGAFLVELENFDISKASTGAGNNTLAIKFNAPNDSKRFRYNVVMSFQEKIISTLC